MGRFYGLKISFDPQALTSLTQAAGRWSKTPEPGFDPQALTSLTRAAGHFYCFLNFCFDPQALTSLTRASLIACGVKKYVSIHRLLRA